MSANFLFVQSYERPPTEAETEDSKRRSLTWWTESEEEELIKRRTTNESWSETHKAFPGRTYKAVISKFVRLSRSNGPKTDSAGTSTTDVTQNESDGYAEIDSSSDNTSREISDNVMVSAPAKRRKVESADHDNAAVQRTDSAQKDDPVGERPESNEPEERQSVEERSDRERQEFEQEQHESRETLYKEHEEPNMPILEKKQLSVSHMMEECMKHFAVQSSQLALEKCEKDRLRHELEEKTQEAQEHYFSIKTRDKEIDELDRRLALEKGEKDRLRHAFHEKTLETLRCADKYEFFIGTRDKRIDELVKGLKERDEQLKNRDEQLEIANERIVRIKKQKGQIRDRKKKLGDRLSEIIIKSMADCDDEEDEEEDDDDDDQFSEGR